MSTRPLHGGAVLPSRLIFTPLLLLTFWASVTFGVRNEVRCGSVDIRSKPEQTAMYDSPSVPIEQCTIVEGDITITMVRNDDNSDDNHEDMFPHFEHLREITGTLLVYFNNIWPTLGRLFPQLRVIGGETLIMNYALIVYQNQNLTDLGLSKLSVIKNGGVRIAENRQLCYVRSIKWESIMVGPMHDLILDNVTADQCEDDCVVEEGAECARVSPLRLACWNATECQKSCPYHKSEPNVTAGAGCTDAGEACHPLCLGGCARANDEGACHTCRGVEVEGICAERCPPHLFVLRGRRCITREQCLGRAAAMVNSISTADEGHWKAFGGVCHTECPAGYSEDPNDVHNCLACVGHCPKRCLGDRSIEATGAALAYRHCNIIEGSLDIYLTVGKDVAPEQLAEAFGEIEEITGYVRAVAAAHLYC